MYHSTQKLEKRGWTKGLIKKYLPEPDSVEHFKKYGCKYFYLISRVERIEQTEDFQNEFSKAQARRASGKLAAENRKKKYLHYLRYEMPVRVKVYPAEKVLLKAIDSYNDRQRDRAWRAYERGQYDGVDFERRSAGTNSDPAFLERITVNFIRHHLTRYDNMLASLHGKTAQEEASKIIQTRIFEAIIDAYSLYRDECERQMIGRGILLPYDRETKQMVLFFN